MFHRNKYPVSLTITMRNSLNQFNHHNRFSRLNKLPYPRNQQDKQTYPQQSSKPSKRTSLLTGNWVSKGLRRLWNRYQKVMRPYLQTPQT